MPGGSRMGHWGHRVPRALWTALVQSHLDTKARLSRTSTAAVRQGIHSGELSGLICTGKMEGILHKEWLHTCQVQQEHKAGESSQWGELGIQCCLGCEAPQSSVRRHCLCCKLPVSGVFIHPGSAVGPVPVPDCECRALPHCSEQAAPRCCGRVKPHTCLELRNVTC